MKIHHLILSVLAGLLITGIPNIQAADWLTPDQAKEIATEAYIYGYPLVTMEMTRRVMMRMSPRRKLRELPWVI